MHCGLWDDRESDMCSEINDSFRENVLVTNRETWVCKLCFEFHYIRHCRHYYCLFYVLCALLFVKHDKCNYELKVFKMFCPRGFTMWIKVMKKSARTRTKGIKVQYKGYFVEHFIKLKQKQPFSQLILDSENLLEALFWRGHPQEKGKPIWLTKSALYVVGLSN